MEEDIQNYLPTVMFRGTPCTKRYYMMWGNNEKKDVKRQLNSSFFLLFFEQKFSK